MSPRTNNNNNLSSLLMSENLYYSIKTNTADDTFKVQ